MKMLDGSVNFQACCFLSAAFCFYRDAAASFKEAAKELRSWIAVVEAARWRNFAEVQSVFSDADAVRGYVVFNIRGNRYRLITVIHYAKDKPKPTNGHVYIRSFLRHSDDDDKKKWDPFSEL